MNKFDPDPDPDFQLLCEHGAWRPDITILKDGFYFEKPVKNSPEYGVVQNPSVNPADSRSMSNLI